MDERREVLFCDLQNQLEPKSAIADKFDYDKWRGITYETKDFKGSMVAAIGESSVPSLTLNPNLKGWYAVYIGLNPSYGAPHSINVRTQSGEYDTFLTPAPGIILWTIDEFFWKYVDMTDESLIFSHPENETEPQSTYLAMVRFVPLSDEEVEKIKKDREQTETKTLYASDDVDNMMLHGPENLDCFIKRVESYRNTDVKILSMEKFHNLKYTSGCEVSMGRKSIRNKAKTCRLFKEKGLDPHKAMIEKGHEIGLQMFLSMRMGMWAFEPPYDEEFICEFYEDHPELRMKDRDGIEVSRLSYAYPETRKYMADLFSEMAKYDCDGVEFLFHRGYPYILFEEPFLEIMREKYGVDARELSNNDPRIIKEKCRIMTDFIIEVKERLNKERAERGQKPLKFAAHVLKTVAGSKFVGLDIKEWVDKEIVDEIICYPLVHYEKLHDDMFRDAEKTIVDIEKYAKGVIEGEEDFKWGFYDACKGVNGRDYDIKEDKEEDIRELVEIFKGKKANLYIDLMRRDMEVGLLRDRVTTLYDWGVEGIALWDTESRIKIGRNRTLLSRLGHKDEVRNFGIRDGKWYRNHNIIKLGAHRMDRYHPNWGG